MSFYTKYWYWLRNILKGNVIVSYIEPYVDIWEFVLLFRIFVDVYRISFSLLCFHVNIYFKDKRNG